MPFLGLQCLCIYNNESIHRYMEKIFLNILHEYLQRLLQYNNTA